MFSCRENLTEQQECYKHECLNCENMKMATAPNLHVATAHAGSGFAGSKTLNQQH